MTSPEDISVPLSASNPASDFDDGDRETSLAKIMRQHIATHGPMDIGQFMNMALCHPQHGYYMKQDPFGRDGDFTTAPEISQMFGEMIGAWIADIWIQMGRPAPFGLVECGPGRGTLMADVMRATKGVEGFHTACVMHLVEISPTLKAMQVKALSQYRPHWHQSLGAVPTGYPLIVLGNEFFDALPLRQLVKVTDGWVERVVTQDLTFGVRPAGVELISQIPDKYKYAQIGTVMELSSARMAAMDNVCGMLKRAGGVALFLDYGYEDLAPGDSFQALRGHEYAPVLEGIGDADLTSHVDFGALGCIADGAGMHVFPVVEQGAFLERLGMAARAQALIQNASAAQAQDIKGAYDRLCSPEGMGKLFKVLAVSHCKDIVPAGFGLDTSPKGRIE